MLNVAFKNSIVTFAFNISQQINHVFYYFSKDLVNVKNDGTINDSPVGQAWVNAICQGENRSSVVEAHGGFISISTAAHELGHKYVQFKNCDHVFWKCG